MSDQQNNQQQQKVKHDPEVVWKKIMAFIGTDVSKNPKLSRDVLSELLGEMQHDQIESVKAKVKATLIRVVQGRKELVEAEKAFLKAKAEKGEEFNKALNEMYQLIEKVETDQQAYSNAATDLGIVSDTEAGPEPTDVVPRQE